MFMNGVTIGGANIVKPQKQIRKDLHQALIAYIVAAVGTIAREKCACRFVNTAMLTIAAEFLASALPAVQNRSVQASEFC